MKDLKIPKPAPPPPRKPHVPIAPAGVVSVDVTLKEIAHTPSRYLYGLWIAGAGAYVGVLEADSMTAAAAVLGEDIRGLYPRDPLLLRGKQASLMVRSMSGHVSHQSPLGSLPTDWPRRLSDVETRAVRELPRLTIATDGSASASSLASGWISDDGRFWAGGHRRDRSRNENALEAEVFAICAAVRSQHPDRRLLVLTDSRAAVALAARAKVSTTGGRQIQHLSQALEQRTVDVTWVAGHSGHPLNEAADRMAVYARRCVDADLTPDRFMLASIAQDVADGVEMTSTSVSQR